MQYKEPSPNGISKELSWQTLKLFRTSKEKTPIIDISGNQFSWSKPDYFEEFFVYLLFRKILVVSHSKLSKKFKKISCAGELE